MMKLFISLFLLAVFTSISNGDLCARVEGSNMAVQGNYVPQGSDVNGNTYYKEVDVGSCNNNFLYKSGNKWRFGESYDASTGESGGSYTTQCNTNSATPVKCSGWGISGLTVTAGGCPETLTNTCGSIDISGLHSYLDGTYDQIADGVYQRADNAYYLSFWEYGRYYMLEEVGDVRCEDGGISSYLRIGEDQLDGIKVNQELTITPLYSCCSSTVSIACSAASSDTGSGSGSGSEITPSPVTPTPTTPAPELGDSSLCLVVTEAAANENSEMSGTGPMTLLTDLAGEYTLIDASDDNYKPVYKLSSSCGTAYIKYVSNFSLYMIVLDIDDAKNTYVGYCTNSGSITNNDITQCTWSSYPNDYKVTNEVSTCSCGQTVSAI